MSYCSVYMFHNNQNYSPSVRVSRYGDSECRSSVTATSGAFDSWNRSIPPSDCVGAVGSLAPVTDRGRARS